MSGQHFHSLPPPETVAAMRALFFGKLAESNRDLTQSLADLTLEIDKQNHNASLGILVYVENRVQAMHNILLVLREYLGG
jgi:hypothetical protein